MMKIYLGLGLLLALGLALGLGLGLRAKNRGGVAHMKALPELVLNERILSISLVAANLSALAYMNAEDYAVVDAEGNTTFAHPDYEEISFYQEEPDQAVVAKKEGRCYLAFRGTNKNLDDWKQNFNLESSNVCKDNGPETNSECCETRAGYAEFLGRDSAVQAYADLVQCLDSVCTDENKDDCLVITGHSQGGASATVASVALYSHLPTVVTFGQPPAMDKDCNFIPSERFYRYVNSRAKAVGSNSEIKRLVDYCIYTFGQIGWLAILRWLVFKIREYEENDDMSFDAIAFSPSTWSNSVHYGYYILVGEDSTAVKYLGFDESYAFTPTVADQGFAAHSMEGEPYSYQTRMSALVSSIPNIKTTGFSEGSVCEGGSYGQLCESGMCYNYQCLANKETTGMNSAGTDGTNGNPNGGLDGGNDRRHLLRG